MRTAKNMSCSKIIRRRRREAETRNGYIQLLARIILVIVCGGLLFTQGFLLMRAPDNGMFPAIKGGDLLIGFRLQRNLNILYKILHKIDSFENALFLRRLWVEDRNLAPHNKSHRDKYCHNHKHKTIYHVSKCYIRTSDNRRQRSGIDRNVKGLCH